MQSFTTVLVLVAALFAGQTLTASLKTKNEPGVYIFEDVINQTLNGIIQNISDPLIIDQLALDFPEGGIIVGHVSVSNAQLSGIRNIVATSINLDILSFMLEMTIQVSTVNLNLNYDADIVAANLIPLYGNGKMNVNIEGIQLDITAKADLSNGISISGTKIMLHLGTATFDLHGLLDNENFSALVSEALNDNFAKFINDNADAISGIISPILEGIINGILHPNSTYYDENIENLYNEFENLDHIPIVLY